jgi:UDP-glucose 4-epimerase
MKFLVTGAAGFIGSHLSRALIARGDEVVGVDCFTDHYESWIKEKAIADLESQPGFMLLNDDLNEMNFEQVLPEIDTVFHLAAQPGVRDSWGLNFRPYVDNNIRATQRLLEAVKDHAPQVKIVFAGSSSVYGDAPDFPTSETTIPQPLSPYGATKLAAENLVRLYHHWYGLKTVSLRYFTVYGPGQRPDMAFHRFIVKALQGKQIPVNGNGEQSRDFTYVDDTVQATMNAAQVEAWGEVFNVGGGDRHTINEVLRLLSEILDRELDVKQQTEVKGDVRHTAANIKKAQQLLGYDPRTKLSQGLSREVAWIKDVILK